jgi:hypothetical protein
MGKRIGTPGKQRLSKTFIGLLVIGKICIAKPERGISAYAMPFALMQF